MDALDAVHSRHTTIYTLDPVCSGHSTAVVHGGHCICTKVQVSNQWMQYAVDAVSTV